MQLDMAGFLDWAALDGLEQEVVLLSSTRTLPSLRVGGLFRMTKMVGRLRMVGEVLGADAGRCS